MAVKVQIILDDNGKITVSGPFDDKLLMFGLLEYARLAVQKAASSQGPNVIVSNLKLPEEK